MAGGMRKVVEEKQLLSELGKYFHTVKAHSNEQKQVKRAAKAAAKSRGKANDKQSGRRGSHRRSKSGGSVWIMLKGGFASSSVPAAQDRKRVQRKCDARGARNERRRMEALEAAEAYVESAWREVKDAGLLADDGKSPSEDGIVYLREQYTIAIRMLNAGAGTGDQLRRLVETNCKGRDGLQLSDACTPATPSSGKAVYSKDQREDMIVREAAIRYRFHDARSGCNNDLTEEALKASLEESVYYHMGEPGAAETTSAGASVKGDIAATKCIVRLRNSQRMKCTSMLSTPKSVNYFKSNIMQVLRKELGGSKLPRGAVEEMDTKQSSSPPQQQQQQQGHGNNKRNNKKKR